METLAHLVRLIQSHADFFRVLFDGTKLLFDGAQVVVAILALRWAVKRFYLEKSEKKTGLQIIVAVRCSTKRKDQRYLVCFDVVIENVGRTTVVARQKLPRRGGVSICNPRKQNQNGRFLWDETPEAENGNVQGAANQEAEQLTNACSLRLRPVPDDVESGGFRAESYDWWTDDGNTLGERGEVDLLSDYRDTTRDDVYFWLEPGETQACGAAVILGKGCYFAKITFLGEDSDDQYWTRTLAFTVPAGDETSITLINGG